LKKLYYLFITMVFLWLMFIIIVSSTSPRIVGGDPVTNTTSFPWLVALIGRYNGIDPTSLYYYRQFCGGTIINQSWILTAAHCTENKTADGIAIVAGTYNLTTSMGELRNVKAIYEHEDYDPSILMHDIALLELEEPLELSDSVEIILPANTDDPLEDGQMYSLAGWGALEEGGYGTPDLYTVEVPAVSLEYCIETLSDFYNINFGYYDLIVENFDTIICAGGVTGKDSCQGDSGGPMTMEVGCAQLIYGIVSWGFGCGTSNLPGVYASVAMHRQWIEETSGLTLGNAESSSIDCPADSSSTDYTIHIIIGTVIGAVVVLAVIALLCVFYRKSKQTIGESRAI